MDFDDESLFGSPPTSATLEPYFAARDPIPLCLPGMSTKHLPNANDAPAQAQSTTSNSQVPHLPHQVLGIENNALDVPFRPQTPVQRRLSRKASKPSSSRRSSSTQRAPISAINPGVPVRLIPTMPCSSAPTAETPLFAPPIAPGYSALPPLPASLLLPPTPPVLNENGASSASVIGEPSSSQKLCTKCHKPKPQSEFSSMTNMGLTKERSQCEPCRRKRRESSARHKLRKEQAETKAEDDQEQLQQHQLPQGGMAQCPHHGLSEHQPTRSSHPLTAVTFVPNALITTQHDPIDLTSPTVPSFFDWPAAQEPEQGVDIKADMAFYGLQSSKQMPSPSLVLPQGTRMEAGLPPTQDHKSELYDIVSVKTLKTPLTKNAETWLLNHEKQKFKEGRNKCEWMKVQEKKTLVACWEKRQASIVLGLVEVPGSDLQPMIGYSYGEGSHQNLPGAYPDDYDWH
ncbi:uncharacterized protein N0V96_001170 [Colletotrichum fioriniae]|uniref:uncharacterized protein n=1 Tax=Colletotrichum fioriniae TaxID=710243 RepID=UPI00230056AB|nr:uncharacterized protein COL516b_010021 [Colletotrichum fioriniae]KAJ0298368.1 hypothetical protein COL516b_010021 [Colletotrichum fioriniae]KAJ3950034.1 hypothetical protein N0V96_001170 [Colletotrichum fioriniae]